jgi:hypothetical protein
MKGLLKLRSALSLRERRAKKTTPNYRAIGSPLAETKDYQVVLERVVNPTLPDGYDWQYAIYNKGTEIIELRGSQFALSVVVMQNQQQMLDKVRSGEMHGYTVMDADIPSQG